MAASLAAQVGVLKQEMGLRPTGLVRHVERVLVEALDLASRFDVDPERVELATWGHDLFRAHPPAEQLRLALECGLEITAADAASPVMLHGPIAAAVLESRFKIVDQEALAAVREHTIGAPEMPLISKIILLADKFERRKRKRTPLMREIRRAARRDLELALLCWADWKWVEERANNWQSHPRHWQARVEWVASHHADAALPGGLSGEAFDARES